MNEQSLWYGQSGFRSGCPIVFFFQLILSGITTVTTVPPPSSGMDGENVYVPEDVLTGRVSFSGSKIAVIGGGLTGIPGLREVATYAGPKSTLSKSREELRLIYEAGLTKAYLGVESGDEQVLKETCKGVNAAQMLEAGRSIVLSGVRLYAIILIGLAGRERSMDNAVATADMINQMQPADLAVMTYTPVPGTKMHRDIEQGKFHMLNETECLIETKALIEHIELEQLHFTSSHASNFVPIEGKLCEDKAKILGLLDDAIKGNIPKRSASQRGL